MIALLVLLALFALSAFAARIRGSQPQLAVAARGRSQCVCSILDVPLILQVVRCFSVEFGWIVGSFWVLDF